MATGDAKEGQPIPQQQQPLTDEDGFTIRPANPWESSRLSNAAQDSDSDDSDTNDTKSERTFTGFKVSTWDFHYFDIRISCSRSVHIIS